MDDNYSEKKMGFAAKAAFFFIAQGLDSLKKTNPIDRVGYKEQL